MDSNKLAETVLLQLECFWILQELDHGWRSKDPSAVAFLNGAYEGRQVKWSDVFPLARLNTVLSLLAVPIAFASRLSESELESFGFRIREEHCLTFKENSAERSPKASEALRIVRNAVAHLPDFASGDQPDVNVAFDRGGVVRFWSKNNSGSEVIFHQESGILEFLRDLTKLCRRAAGKQVTVS